MEKEFGCQIPNLQKMLRFRRTEEVLNVNNQGLMREDVCVEIVRRAGKGFIGCNERAIEAHGLLL